MIVRNNISTFAVWMEKNRYFFTYSKFKIDLLAGLKIASQLHQIFVYVSHLSRSHGKNIHTKLFKNLAGDTNLKIILLDYQNNHALKKLY